MVHSYDVGTIFGPMFVQCIVRTMFVPCSYNVRTMFVQWPKKFVQCSYNRPLKFVQYCTNFWPLYEHCTNIVQTLYPESPKIVNLLWSLTYVNQKTGQILWRHPKLIQVVAQIWRCMKRALHFLVLYVFLMFLRQLSQATFSGNLCVMMCNLFVIQRNLCV